jgi:hypothetical protein
LAEQASYNGHAIGEGQKFGKGGNAIFEKDFDLDYGGVSCERASRPESSGSF